MASFFKTTILGGILFLLPLAIVLMIVGYLLKLAATVAKPLADRLEGARLGRCGGHRLVTVLSILVLVSFRSAPASSPAPTLARA